MTNEVTAPLFGRCENAVGWLLIPHNNRVAADSICPCPLCNSRDRVRCHFGHFRIVL